MIKQIKFKDKVLDLPLIQGGMGVGVSLGNLAGNVAKEGAMGVISAAHPGYLRKEFRKDPLKENILGLHDEIKKAKAIASGKGLIGVNIMVAGQNYQTYVKESIKAGADAIISGAGLPLELPSLVTDNTLIAPIVSSFKACNVILKSWDRRYKKTADFIVIEGSEAGGHLGFKVDDLLNNTVQSLKDILLEVKELVKTYQEKYQKDIPIFVAGGIYDKEDIDYYQSLGADGVQMATRFIATHECDADDRFKQAIVNCTKEEIKIVNSPTGFPGRAVFNKFYQNNLKRGCNIRMEKCLQCMIPCNPLDTPYCISEALISSARGFTDGGVVFVGSKAHLINEIISVKELIDSLFRGKENDK